MRIELVILLDFPQARLSIVYADELHLVGRASMLDIHTDWASYSADGYALGISRWLKRRY